ncbi:cupin domain-containing protein [Schumannella soli]|uniref:Cupin domain-containing protein n=1 Tax=Schumannella soli TaxID=2590779 RepID=A0A506YA28_9MICO|nr:cupin domain-containing protein [Schumannella soli]TPW77309.1 cupin domain-containing protein [Schumannella soli]
MADAAGDASDGFIPASHVDALSIALEHEPLPADEVEAGAPTAGIVELGTLPGGSGLDYGIWEMSAGAARDVEADELFVVLAGRGTVEFLDAAPGSADRILTLAAGSVVRLHAGQRTLWTITEPLRKVYVTPSA